MGNTNTARTHSKIKKPRIIDKKTRIDLSFFLKTLIIPTTKEAIAEKTAIK